MLSQNRKDELLKTTAEEKKGDEDSSTAAAPASDAPKGSLVLCAGYCCRAFFTSLIEVGGQKGSNEFWTCNDCIRSVHKCFICGIRGEVKRADSDAHVASTEVTKVASAVESQVVTFYEARDNETPRQIAKRHGIEVRALVTLNRLKYPALSASAKLMEGTTLDFPIPDESGEARAGEVAYPCNEGCGRFYHPSCIENRLDFSFQGDPDFVIKKSGRGRWRQNQPKTNKITVVASNGDTVVSIASRYGVDVESFLKSNRKAYPSLEASSTLEEGLYFDIHQLVKDRRVFRCSHHRCASADCNRDENIGLLYCVGCPTAYHISCVPTHTKRLSVTDIFCTKCCVERDVFENLSDENIRRMRAASLALKRSKARDSNVRGRKRLRSARCGRCAGCTRRECGKCRNCLDKPKFGGTNSLRQACKVRKCTFVKRALAGFCTCDSAGDESATAKWIACSQCDEYFHRGCGEIAENVPDSEWACAGCARALKIKRGKAEARKRRLEEQQNALIDANATRARPRRGAAPDNFSQYYDEDDLEGDDDEDLSSYRRNAKQMAVQIAAKEAAQKRAELRAAKIAAASLANRPLYCLCQQPDRGNEFYIGCEGGCGDWFHPKCVGLDEDACRESPPKKWKCPSCRNKASLRKRRRGQSGSRLSSIENVSTSSKRAKNPRASALKSTSASRAKQCLPVVAAADTGACKTRIAGSWMTKGELCNVCAQSGEIAPMVKCIECSIVVHQACYGVSDPDTNWKCDWCSEAPRRVKAKGESARTCALCPVQGGPLKPTFDRRWCHISCALYVPEITFGKQKRLRPVKGLTAALKRHGGRCCMCKNASGATITCAELNCSKRFHVMCARVNGCTMTTRGAARGGIEFIAYCPDHGSSTACKICLTTDNPDDILLCDRCDGEYHMSCLEPPLAHVPTGDWFCPRCATMIAQERNSALYCVCKQPDRPNAKYLGCDECGQWFHLSCMRLDVEPPLESWFCPTCAPKVAKKRKSELYCYCQQPEPTGASKAASYMQCDKCEDWFHTACAGFTAEEAEKAEEFVCKNCTGAPGGSGDSPAATRI